MTNIPRNLRNNIISYANYVTNNTPGRGRNFQDSLIQYLRENAASSYNRENIGTFERLNSELAVKIKKARYDDLFEDFVQSGYIDLSSIEGEDDLREALSQSLIKNKNLSKFKDSTPRKFQRMIKEFVAGMSDAKRAVKLLEEERRAVMVNEDNKERYEDVVKKERRIKFERLVRQNRVVGRYDAKTKKESVIYRDKKGRYRDINSGAFVKQPRQLSLK
jgi:hypothetical protein